MAETLTEFLGKYFSHQAVVFLISLMPILELRGGLIAAAIFKVPYLNALGISVLGNMLPIPVIIIFIERILVWMRGFGPLKGIGGWIEEKGMSQGAKLQKKYPNQLKLGLLLFVGIPLPGTGAWTGALIASFLGLDLKNSAPYICLGVLLAAAIMSIITYGIPALAKML
ncbi:MAG: small multi-drug export protein [Clostridiales bacterium]|jgi:uncharacterized membrane protein|nr:small multi-drug export protein [Clostridiales bacterium]MDR2752467.1 small multi-drug export protein [Clostridiales bacterium]